MKAIVKKYREKGLWLEDVPKPEPGDNEVLIKIKQTAICGTDIHIYQWNDWAQKTIPVPMHVGHEFAGIIEALGKNVKGYAVGERVSGEGHVVCGRCRNCKAGHRHLCINTKGVGVNRPGAFAEYLAIPAENVFPLPDDISDDEASILDPLGNAVHTALSFDLVGEDVLITGAGPIGIMGAAVAQHVGARHVVITDLNEYRLELARKMGIKNVVDVRGEKLPDVMRRLKMNESFSVGLEMSGSASAFNDMISSVKMGAKIALLGILPPNTTIPWGTVIFKALTMKCIYGREIFETWYKMCAMLQSGLDVKPIITHRFPVERFKEGLDIMATGNSGKIILDWTN
ncbi:MAG: L-threonine 3-dehydrogenase [Elusimicrobia bacterium GWC2_51_8]|nr:MAG: L-threonine 3-dehydrogenase [Elusimicrobia bacterium GWA2_51_34]OGR60822.1 MAG: L-threonine 3-dehydrogenase [Elusimicrobia bacterium GWC2_51_8]HAF95808.1 L-threonine 3-dehydrogenase [Elusimicrobiota bacterium]HCE98245.1 L-threonine 3-dehydrogenase [Elusimicrobiota bacterium]